MSEWVWGWREPGFVQYPVNPGTKVLGELGGSRSVDTAATLGSGERTPNSQSSVCDLGRGSMKTPESDFISELLEPLRPAARAWALASSRMEALPKMSLDLVFLSSSTSHMGLIILPGAGGWVSCALQGVDLYAPGVCTLKCQKHPCPQL